MSREVPESAYIDLLARCDRAFRPFEPIDLRNFFVGRLRHIERLTEELKAPGRHAILYGERGVGKTSLARLAYHFMGQTEKDTVYVRCFSTSTFESIFSEALAKAGVEFVLNGIETDSARLGKLGVSFAGLAGSVGKDKSQKEVRRRIGPASIVSPRFLLENLSGKGTDLLIIDEFDRVSDPPTRTRLAELIKHFSDDRSKTKILVVGVGETVSQLIGEHLSLSRSLAQIKLERMSDEELTEIVRKGEEFVPLRCNDEVRRRIVKLADGFPYFVHLLCLYAGRNALRGKAPKTRTPAPIDAGPYMNGLKNALDNTEASLTETFEKAVVTTRRKSDVFLQILKAMASSSEREVQVNLIADRMAMFIGERRKPSTFSGTLGELRKEKRGTILTRVREGYYKFTDPLMRPYIRVRLELENVETHAGQLRFPFMEDA